MALRYSKEFLTRSDRTRLKKRAGLDWTLSQLPNLFLEERLQFLNYDDSSTLEANSRISFSAWKRLPVSETSRPERLPWVVVGNALATMPSLGDPVQCDSGRSLAVFDESLIASSTNLCLMRA